MRRAKEKDLGDLKRIIVEAFGHETIHYLIEDKFGIVGGKSWKERKADEIESFFRAHPDKVLVSEREGKVVGFVSYSLDHDRRLGTIQNNAVDPDFQGKGIGTKQILCVLDIFRKEGLELAEVRTGKGPGYMPARRMYEKCGFEATMESVTYHLSLLKPQPRQNIYTHVGRFR